MGINSSVLINISLATIRRLINKAYGMKIMAIKVTSFYMLLILCHLMVAFDF